MTFADIKDLSTQQVVAEISKKSQNVADLSLPVYVGGVLPQPTALEPLAIQTGEQAKIDFITVNNVMIQATTSKVFKLSVGAIDDGEMLANLSASGAIILKSNNLVSISGEGYLPNSQIVAWIFSTPRRLGVVSVSANGKFAETLTVPADMIFGDHTLQVNGFTVNSEVRSLNLAVEIVATVQSSPKPQVGITSFDPVVGNSSGSRTSTSSTTAALAVVAFLSVGLFLLVLTTRRRKN